MNANWWLWIALIAFLVFCCLPMLFMGRHRRRSPTAAQEDKRENKFEPLSELREQSDKKKQSDERT